MENNRWTLDFIKLLSANKITEAQNLKFQQLPNSLFKYREFDKDGYSVRNFQNDSLWLSSADKFNDPYDSFFMLSQEPLESAIWRESKERIKAFLSEKQQPILTSDDVDRHESLSDLMQRACQKDKNISPKLILALREAWGQIWEDFCVNKFRPKIQAGMKVCSLSETNTSMVMWRYYSNNHSGFCIEYDLIATKTTDAQLIYMVYPVIYVDELPDMATLLVGGNPLMAAIAALHKSVEWSYEREWRFIFPSGSSQKSFNMRAPKIKAVYLGMAIDSKAKEQMISIAKEKRIAVYEMHFLSNSYHLGFRENKS